MKKSLKVAVVGAGNGGQAIAGHIASMGYSVCMYDRNAEKVSDFSSDRTINLVGALEVKGEIEFASIDLEKVIADCELIMIATTATAHQPLATQLAPILTDGQTIVLNPGRTCGALEFRNTLEAAGLKSRVYVAEAQTLVYACRVLERGKVNIIGVKDKVLLSAYPASDTEHVLDLLSNFYQCFYPARNVLQTSFENIGAIFHPAVVLLNETIIERGKSFYFYRDMTPGLSKLIEAADRERLAVANAYGINPISAFDWISYAYDGVEGNTLCERMQNNPAYSEIISPTSIDCRQITEDIPTGIIPMAELGDAAGIDTPVFDSLITMCSLLLDRDFKSEGRTLERLGLKALTKEEIITKIH